MAQTQTKLSAIQKQLEYWRAFGMKNDPFDDDSIEGRYFWGEEREELLRKALQLACCATRAVVFYGPKGIGKTKLLQALRARLDDDEQIVVVEVPAGRMTTPQQLFVYLGQAFDLPIKHLEPAEIEVRIKERLQESENTQSKLVILVDDADRLPELTLASLLVMARYPDNYISVLLFAATDGIGMLRAELRNEEIMQLAMEPFDAFTLEAYVRYRLDLVGGDRHFPFTQADLASLLKESRGIPKRIDELARQKLHAVLTPRASPSIENRRSLLRIALPKIKLPMPAEIKWPRITLPQIELPRITMPWQPLAAAAGLVLFVGAVWLLTNESGDGQLQPTTAALPAAEPKQQAAAALPNSRETPAVLSMEPAKPVARRLKQPQIDNENALRPLITEAGEGSAVLATVEPANIALARKSAADQEWIDHALSLSPAAGSGQTVAPRAAATSAISPSTASPPKASPEASHTIPVERKAAPVTEPKRERESLQARLEPVKVKQKYTRKARGALPVDERYLLKFPKGSYTLQLLGSSSKKGMRDFVKNNNSVEIRVFEHEMEGRPWYVAVTGSYETVEQARDGLAELPVGLRSLKPWPRQFSSVHSDIRRYRQR